MRAQASAEICSLCLWHDTRERSFLDSAGPAFPKGQCPRLAVQVRRQREAFACPCVALGAARALGASLFAALHCSCLCNQMDVSVLFTALSGPLSANFTICNGFLVVVFQLGRIAPLSPLCLGCYRGTRTEGMSDHSHSTKTSNPWVSLDTVPIFLMLSEKDFRLYSK